VVVPNVPCELSIEGAQQIVIEKQDVDMFTVPNLRGVVDRLGAQQCVVYGVVTEICVWFAALGLLKAGRAVTVVTDAVETLNALHSERVLGEIVAAGGRLARVDEVLAAGYRP